jgi:hypothetical protein
VNLPTSPDGLYHYFIAYEVVDVRNATIGKGYFGYTPPEPIFAQEIEQLAFHELRKALQKRYPEIAEINLRAINLLAVPGSTGLPHRATK